MPPLVVPNVCRYAVNQSIGGQEVVNIIDMQVDTTGSEVSRQDACEDVARDILNAWSDRFLVNMSTEITARSVSWLDINSLTGSTGEVQESSENTWPMPGVLTGTGVMPAMVALRVDKATAGGRGTKRGRMYLCGLRENETDVGVALSWNASMLSDWNLGLAGFLEDINDQDVGGIPLAVQRQMVVVHASAGTWSDVTSLTANPLVSTQVRRGALR